MRYDDWQIRYQTFIASRLNAPFVWGANDCVMFAADAYDAISPDGVTTNMRRALQWTTALEAARMLKNLGGLRSACESILGEATEAWLSLSQGDVVLAINGDGDEVLTVHDGSKLLAPGPEGLISLPLRASRCGWRV